MTDAKRHPHLLRSEDTILVVVDMQETFLRVIHDRERLTANVRLLIEAAKVLSVPVVASTQYALRLGPCSEEIASALPDAISRPLRQDVFLLCG